MTSPLRCKKFVLWPAAVFSLFLCFQHGHSDELTNPRTRHINTDEDAPPEIRFRQLLTMLILSPDQTGDRGNRELQELGIAVQDIPTVRTYLESLYEQPKRRLTKAYGV